VKVLVDTSVWSLALRRRAPAASGAVEEFRRLVIAGRVAVIGAIRQEILSGVRDRAAFEQLRDRLRAFPDQPLGPEDYERAAEHYTTCRAAGIQGSNTDFLICAVSERHALPILTTDVDFKRYAAVLPIALYAR